MKKFVLHHLVLLAVLLSLPGLALAQTGELTRAYTSEDGRLVVHYPQGWIVAIDDVVNLANTHEAMAASLNGELPAPGDIVVHLLLPDQMAALNLPMSGGAAGVLQAFITATALTGTAEPYPAVGIPAASTFVSEPDVPNGQLVALEFDGGVLVAALEFGDAPANSASAVAEILNGLSYDGQSAAGSGGPVGMAATTAEPLHEWAASADGTSEYGESSWSFSQATGEPNTPDCGDRSTAWASASSVGRDVLVLDFAQAVLPTEVNIYQTYNPGSIVGVELSNSATDARFDVPNSVDPPGNTPCPGVLSLDASSIGQPVDRVTLTLDQTIGGSWNEIDAVELVGLPADTAGPAPLVTANFQNVLAIDHPADWATDLTGDSPILASVAAALDLSNDDKLPVGAMRIEIALPETIEEMGLPPTGTIEEIVGAVVAAFGSSSAVAPYDGLDNPAAISFIEGADLPAGAALIGIETSDGPLLVAVRTADFAGYESLLQQMLNSIELK